jgi:heterodisulfide reductase subunit A-like polyferredoxin
LVKSLIHKLTGNEKVRIRTGCTIGRAEGFVGNFNAEIVTPDGKQNVSIGSIVVATKAKMSTDSNEEDFEKDLLLQRDERDFFVGTLGILNPLDFNTDGVFRCGSAREEMGTLDAIVDGEAAASRAAGIISQKQLVKSAAKSLQKRIANELANGKLPAGS